MRTTLARLRSFIKENISFDDELSPVDDVGGPTMDWSEWYEELDLAAGEQGFELLSDLPVYDNVSSQSTSALQMEEVLREMWKQGTLPADAVVQMMDPRSFWSTWGSWVPGNNVG